MEYWKEIVVAALTLATAVVALLTLILNKRRNANEATDHTSSKRVDSVPDVSVKAIHLAGTWSGKLKQEKYELHATLDVRSGRVSGKINWTLVDSGKNRLLANNKPKGSTAWTAVDGTLKPGKLLLHGGIVSDKELLAEGGELSLTLNGDGTFIGSSHHVEYGDGIMEGTFDEV